MARMHYDGDLDTTRLPLPSAQSSADGYTWAGQATAFTRAVSAMVDRLLAAGYPANAETVDIAIKRVEREIQKMEPGGELSPFLDQAMIDALPVGGEW